MHDEVNNPKHYDLFPDMQVIDVIKRALTDEEFKGYLKGNILKYRLRAGEKGSADKCIAKSHRYRNMLFDGQVDAKKPTYNESRMDIIGQNGNDGAVYNSLNSVGATLG